MGTMASTLCCSQTLVGNKASTNFVSTSTVFGDCEKQKDKFTAIVATQLFNIKTEKYGVS